MRRTKKFCWQSGRRERSENPWDSEAENQVETDAEREGEHRTGEPVQRLAYQERPVEEQPLLISAVSNNSHDVNRCPRGSGCVRKYHGVCDKAAIGLGYLILVLAALPVGLSSGGLSFFRFDAFGGNFYFSSTSSIFAWPNFLTYIEAPVWWSPFQIFFFFMYSHLACGNQRRGTWTIPTNFSKLIRNDWFASNIYLLVLGVVEPFCSLSGSVGIRYFVSFAVYNSVNTVCNFLFLIILNKHKVVTRYVFYISVCMICAYIESDVVALFYFALNSEGSLQNVKLTAIRTAAITLTLIVRFRTSMHIIRKLINPRESLFEGLGEQWVLQWHRNPRKNQKFSFYFFRSWLIIGDYQVICFWWGCALRKFHVTDGQNTRDQITSDSRSKRAWSKCVLCIPFILGGSPNEMLATYMRRVRNSNLEIWIAGSSRRPK